MHGVQAVPGFWHTQWAVLAAVWQVLQGPERRAVRLALVIAFIDQAMASTAVVNYAPEVCIACNAAALNLGMDRTCHGTGQGGVFCVLWRTGSKPMLHQPAAVLQMLMQAGLSSSDATLWTSAIPAAKVPAGAFLAQLVMQVSSLRRRA